MSSGKIFGSKPSKTGGNPRQSRSSVGGLNKRSVIKGDFSSYKINYREMRIYKFNKFLAFLLLLFVVIAIIMAITVVFRGNTARELHNKTVKINYENTELQNKVDNMKSFYSIDTKVSKIDFLKKADRVIEVKAINNAPQKPDKNPDLQKLRKMPAGF